MSAPGIAERLRARRERTGIFLDFDGTLSPIVDNPAEAHALDGVVSAIDALAAKFALVAVVSGRPVDFLQARLPVVPTVRLRGLYGVQQYKSGKVVERADIAKYRPVVDAGATTAEAELPRGLRIERKGISFVLHYRETPEHAPVAEEWAARFSMTSGLEAQKGRLSIEIGPFLDSDKGASVRELSKGLATVAVIGDDTGDIPMFVAARETGAEVINVAVRSTEVPARLLELADATVDGPAGVLDLLRRLV